MGSTRRQGPSCLWKEALPLPAAGLQGWEHGESPRIQLRAQVSEALVRCLMRVLSRQLT